MNVCINIFCFRLQFWISPLIKLRIIQKIYIRKTNSIIHLKKCNRKQMEARVKYLTYLRSVHFIQHHNGGAVVVEH